MKYYTNVHRFGSKMLVRGYNDGRPFSDKVHFEPTLYVTDKTGQSEIKSIDGRPIKPHTFDSMNDAKAFMDRYSDVEGFDIFGNPAWLYQYISSTWTKDIKWNISDLKILSMDIETTTEHRMTVEQVLQDPKEKITLITLQDKTSKKITVFTWKDFSTENFPSELKDVRKVVCQDERDMLERFILFFSGEGVDVITGWNTKYFDIPYIVKRAERLFGGDEFVKNLSPWKLINHSLVEAQSKYHDEYDIIGTSHLDYLELYKKYIKEPRESYKLDNIAYVELGKNKIKNPTPSFYGFYSGDFDITDQKDIQEEYRELHTLSWNRWRLKEKLREVQNSGDPVSVAQAEKIQSKINEFSEKMSEMSWNIFCLYNIIDTVLVDQLEDKLKLIELQITLAYFAKVNFEDIFGQVKVWETIIFNHLKDTNRIPSVKSNRGFKGDKFAGAYVKEPIPGIHKHIVSFDLDSLYPHLIMGYNISPETLVQDFNEMRDEVTIDKLLHKEVDTSILKELNYSMAANGVCFTRERQGFLPELMESYYADRKKYKKEMLIQKSEYQKNPSKDLEYSISRLDNLQMALKILLNSAYGSLGNAGFKYYDLRIAEGITSSGQLAIQWIANKFNGFLNKHCGTVNEEYVVYVDTDSVTGYTLVNVNGVDIQIQDLYERFSEFEYQDDLSKNYVKPVSNTKTLSFNTSTQMVEEKDVKYVMKHQVKKRMFRITDVYNSVIVTEDHSIIAKSNGKYESIKPEELDNTQDVVIHLLANKTDYIESSDFNVEDLGIQEIDVYDIEVEDNHNFFGNNILVHNSNYVKLEKVVEAWTKSEIKKGNNPTEEDKINFMDKFSDKVLQPLIEKSYQELADYMNSYKQKMSMKRENLCSTSLFASKKKYILNVWDSEGVRYKEPKLKVTGLDLVKSSTPEFLKSKLKETINIILFEDNDKLRRYVQDFKTEFDQVDPMMIAKPVSINDLEKYVTPDGKYSKGIPINARAAAVYNKMIDRHNLSGVYDKIVSGDKIKFIYLRTPNPTGENVIGINTEIPKEFNIIPYIDYDTMYEKMFISPVEIMTKPIKWTLSPESSLKEFF